jgi:hypothetical protein
MYVKRGDPAIETAASSSQESSTELRALAHSADLDLRFDPRAYRYIQDAVANAVLPSTVLSSDRSIDLRTVLPATAEAFVYELFRSLWVKLRTKRATSATLALIVPPFDERFVGEPSSEHVRQQIEVQGWRGVSGDSGSSDEEGASSGGEFFPYYSSLVRSPLLHGLLKSHACRLSVAICTSQSIYFPTHLAPIITPRLFFLSQYHQDKDNASEMRLVKELE